VGFSFGEATKQTTENILKGELRYRYGLLKK
jgi:hypothetical protein